MQDLNYITMKFFKKNRRIILLFILFFGLFFTGQESYELLTHGIDKKKNILVELSRLMTHLFLALGAFWKLYIAKGKQTY